jgi:rhamnogalacturonyl hydrolase YesR
MAEMRKLVRALSEMLAEYPSREKYLTQFREMADELAAIQSKDGL